MGYYVRAFCTTDDLPPLRTVLESAAGRAAGLILGDGSSAIHSGRWGQALIRYHPEREPLLAEANRAGDRGLLVQEVQELLEQLGDVEESPEKDEVIAHLAKTRAVVAVQLPSDVDDEGYKALGAFLGYFAEHSGGLIQADGEGFYEGNRLIVALA